MNIKPFFPFDHPEVSSVKLEIKVQARDTGTNMSKDTIDYDQYKKNSKTSKKLNLLKRLNIISFR